MQRSVNIWAEKRNKSLSSEKNFKQQLDEYTHANNFVPNNIFIIWFGEEVPNSSERPYFNNVIKHKALNPDVNVQLIVSKELLKDNQQFLTLARQCEEHNVTLRDIDETCSSYMNYDITKELLNDVKNYSWASNLLRLALIYHEGGWYFDTDIEPTGKLDLNNPKYGFYQYYAMGASIDAEFCFLGAVKNHFLFLYAAVVLRFWYEEFKAIPADFPFASWARTTHAPVWQVLVNYLGGNPFYYLFKKTTLTQLYSSDIVNSIGYPLSEKAKISYDGNWLGTFEQKTKVDDALTINTQIKNFKKFLEITMRDIDERFLQAKYQEFFPDYFTFRQSRCG